MKIKFSQGTEVIRSVKGMKTQSEDIDMTYNNKIKSGDKTGKWRRFFKNPRASVSLFFLSLIFILSLFSGLCLTDPATVTDPAEIDPYRKGIVRIIPEVPVCRIEIDKDFTITSVNGNKETWDWLKEGTVITNFEMRLREDFITNLKLRFENQPADAILSTIYHTTYDIAEFADLKLIKYTPKKREPKTIRIQIGYFDTPAPSPVTLTFTRDINGHFSPTYSSKRITTGKGSGITADMISDYLRQKNLKFTDTKQMVKYKSEHGGHDTKLEYYLEPLAWPFRPVNGHPLGIDNAGRDVLAQIAAGTRIALIFGIILVFSSMILGIAIGAVQGYIGGIVDISTQRFIEIWSSLPFLYVMILVGSVLGRSFALLLLCYGLFNWIGISYYMRAEFLRLRSRPFVEAAKTQGLSPFRIILRHILPNALTPIITLMPFSLIGAIASISALDFLGFGLPPLTPSLGELLSQAQETPTAWWLSLYPSLTLFIIMLLSVFVGEGLRDAFDPKPTARYR